MNLGEIQGTISLLHIGFVVCVILAIVFLGLAVTFFFRFNILQVIQQKTGWAAKKELAAFNEQNSTTTGSLGRGNSIALGERTPVGLQESPSRGFGKGRSRRLGSKRLSGQPPGMMPGAPPGVPLGAPPGAPPPDPGAGLTTRLSSENVPRGPAPPLPSPPPGFVVVKEVLIVHTDAEIR
jgi:hypothetical protein